MVYHIFLKQLTPQAVVVENHLLVVGIVADSGSVLLLSQVLYNLKRLAGVLPLNIYLLLRLKLVEDVLVSFSKNELFAEFAPVIFHVIQITLVILDKSL